jgi:hypothetical protein
MCDNHTAAGEKFCGAHLPQEEPKPEVVPETPPSVRPPLEINTKKRHRAAKQPRQPKALRTIPMKTIDEGSFGKVCGHDQACMCGFAKNNEGVKSQPKVVRPDCVDCQRTIEEYMEGERCSHCSAVKKHLEN